MIVCVPVSDDGRVADGWGRTPRIALATVDHAAVTDWQELDVRWDVSHDEGAEGSHHARVVRFLREHGVQVVVAHHMGAPMERTIATMGIRTVLGAAGDAREAAADAVGPGASS